MRSVSSRTAGAAEQRLGGLRALALEDPLSAEPALDLASDALRAPARVHVDSEPSLPYLDVAEDRVVPALVLSVPPLDPGKGDLPEAPGDDLRVGEEILVGMAEREAPPGPRGPRARTAGRAAAPGQPHTLP